MNEIPDNHPRAESLRIRHKIIEGMERNVVAKAGLIAHGRGEAFDYLLGEKTTPPARKAIRAAAAALLLSKHPVISVNGNSAALTPKEIVELSEVSGAKLEVNIFYRSPGRVEAIKEVLEKAGAKEVLGVGETADGVIPEISSVRRVVDRRGILIADTVLVPIEDGDRTQALRKMGKTVIAVDLNPLSRTSQSANITIVDNHVRCMPLLVEEVKKLKNVPKEELKKILEEYDNQKVLGEILILIRDRLTEIAKKGIQDY
ncbi:MAG: phosphopantothenate/pantothenate synthetase [Candidatus Freyarchaeota archaeon]|nr:phosphopantothenate/pantothenate synthetase [Candidatus Jordarchaeia archaeon]MBS7270612.1 phosphopantothenate/pantothenate synthetase [Candidatus Jordarchaeia archaeon]MBS7279715.1 phosphopantothenate/pantothenate synthetase [Candidatus Jordarchaeia archaeon]